MAGLERPETAHEHAQIGIVSINIGWQVAINKARQAAIQRARKVLNLAEVEAMTLVEAASDSAVEAWLETAGGDGSVPTNLSDIQADHLKRIANRLKRIPTEAEVAFLFRTTSSRSRSILDRVHATYAEPLYEQVLDEMRSDAVVTPSGSVEDGLTYLVTFHSLAPFKTALGLVLRNWDKNPDVRITSSTKSLVLPRKLGETDPLDVLGIAKPVNKK